MTEIDKEQLSARIWELLKTVDDPEMHVNIVDLGLVYNVTLTEEEIKKTEKLGFCKRFFKKPVEAVEKGFKVVIEMTLTSPTCPMGPHIFSNIYDVLGFLKGITSVDISLVWEPPWSQEKISEAGKMQLGMV